MIKFKIYIAGPMTGIENYNREAFFAMEKELKGHIILNPAHHPEGFTQPEYMHICFAMIDVCDAIVLLPGWERSTGAKFEYQHALSKGKIVFDERKAQETFGDMTPPGEMIP